MREDEGKKSVAFVFLALLDLEKSYDRVGKEVLWQVVEIYGMRRKVLKSWKSFYEENSTCVRVVGSVSSCFRVEKRQRHGCGMS